MSEEMRDLVKKGYEEGDFVGAYERTSEELENFEKCMCDELISKVKKGGSVLDLGCGTGLPYDKYFSDNGFSVTGVDISKKHIELAKKNVEDGKFINDDFFSEEIEGKYDAITSFYAIFHIPRKEHKRLLERIHSLLSDEGYVLITLGVEDMEYDTESDFVGASMAWSSYSVEENKRLVREAGFEIIIASEVHKKEDHLWILGRKK